MSNRGILKGKEKKLRCLLESRAKIIYLYSHQFEIFNSQRRKVFQPVFSIGKLRYLLVFEAQRPHNVPLESGGSRFGRCFTLTEEYSFPLMQIAATIDVNVELKEKNT